MSDELDDDIESADHSGDDVEQCHFCDGMEDCLVDAARHYKSNGWDPDGEGPWYPFGFTTSCEACGRSFDFEAADQAYQETEGPKTPTGSPADEVRRLAAQLGVDANGVDALLDVFQQRPMRG